METKPSPYDHVLSDQRILQILNSAEAFEELDDIPSRDRLTYSNGFYVNCTAVFIDIRESSKLVEAHTRPVLGKLYRAYLSECVAVMNGEERCREVVINGDCVSGIFSTPLKSNVDRAFETAARLNSLSLLLNWRLEQKCYSTFRVGVGMSYGRALMLKAGYNGSGINDVIWMGDVVNEASKLCHAGSRGERAPMQIAEVVRNNLNDKYRAFLTALWDNQGHLANYECHAVDAAMDQYVRELKEKSAQQNALARALRLPGEGMLSGSFLTNALLEQLRRRP